MKYVSEQIDYSEYNDIPNIKTEEFHLNNDNIITDEVNNTNIQTNFSLFSDNMQHYMATMIMLNYINKMLEENLHIQSMFSVENNMLIKKMVSSGEYELRNAQIAVICGLMSTLV